MVHDLLADQGKADPELQRGPAGFTIPDLTQSGLLARSHDLSRPKKLHEFLVKAMLHGFALTHFGGVSAVCTNETVRADDA